ncbi:hypothetical protein QNI19_37040 [Cytophagaceae bacterium DM2B3-1]|uniref:DUF4292 domain-containing protein n=1 Tax=Xanthocytophaga flava TaxID=3048013 RepID=A0ABT7CXV0_9BACT|nr:hypothetical protein [Xanthocytophaga flavus]MDJ1498600.1 hypothetical protein [Xanthocytophaga flavus]
MQKINIVLLILWSSVACSYKTARKVEVTPDTMPVATISPIADELKNITSCDSLMMIDSMVTSFVPATELINVYPAMITIKKQRAYNSEEMEVVGYIKNHIMGVFYGDRKYARTQIGAVSILLSDLSKQFYIFNTDTEKAYQIEGIKIREGTFWSYCFQNLIVFGFDEAYDSGIYRDLYFITDRNLSKINTLGILRQFATRGDTITHINIGGKTFLKQSRKKSIDLNIDYAVIEEEIVKKEYTYQIPVDVKNLGFEEKKYPPMHDPFKTSFLDFKNDHISIKEL